MIPVIEIFGPTIQGEGAVIGQKTMFVRTYGCDYRCNWCDSKFTWDGTAKDQVRMMTADDVLKELLPHREYFSHVTISGGNPALIASDEMLKLISLLHRYGKRVGMETQGSRWQHWMLYIDDLVLSPKPLSSGMPTDYSMLDAIISRVSRDRVSLKVVVFDDQDFAYARKIREAFPFVPMYLQVGNEHTGDAHVLHRLIDRLEWLFQKVIEDPMMNDVRPLPQLHTLVWGNKRGV